MIKYTIIWWKSKSKIEFKFSIGIQKNEWTGIEYTYWVSVTFFVWTIMIGRLYVTDNGEVF